MAVDLLHTLVATGQFLTAYREAERLAMNPELDPSLKAKVFILGSRAAFGLRELYAAAKMAEKAVEAAELDGDWEDVGSARLHSAIIYSELGDAAQALRFFHLFFQHLDRYPSLKEKAPWAYYNLGLTHQRRREYMEALHAYQQAAEGFQDLNQQVMILASLQNRIWVLLLQGKPEQAAPILAEARALSAQLEHAEYQVTQLIIEALHASLTGSPEQAVALCEEVFQPNRRGANDRHRAEAAWIMARVTLEANRLREATLFTNLAVNYALQAKDPHLMNLASDVRRRLRRHELPAG